MIELGTLTAVPGTVSGTVTPTPVAGLDTFTAGIQQSMLPWASSGSDFDRLNVALAGMFETVFGIVADQGSPDEPGYQAGWSVLLNPQQCAARFPLLLPWLSLFVGVDVPIGTPTGAAANAILGLQGFRRGQGFGGTYDSSNGVAGGSIVVAAQTQLSGSQRVTLLERTAADGSVDAYHFVLVVAPEQVINAAALTAAVDAVKPGGVLWTLVQQDAWTWAEAQNDWSADAMTWTQSAQTRP